jgi:L-histidine N-alpha-methyltransferase
MENFIDKCINASPAVLGTQFFNDVIEGLSGAQKCLSSKYFYDAEGDRLFQEIMKAPEYYVTPCEFEIFTMQKSALADAIMQTGDEFDLIELGAGDATKTFYLLQELQFRGGDFTYLPIDISENIIEYLDLALPVSLPGLKVKGLNGDYLDMLHQVSSEGKRRKVVLLLGANIGNMPPETALQFCSDIRRELNENDSLLIGFDLKKDPATILAAYNDRGRITRDFNLNLLTRINRELDADFAIDNFAHRPVYDPHTGACRSYLVSLIDQQVTIGPHTISFYQFETIYMEISQKYVQEDIKALARESGFKEFVSFSDTKGWFIDSLWKAI